jgi:8-oxo-dGTP pyrophosphatase MutT (NUDIX family)
MGFVTIKHVTASTFVFSKLDDEWRLGLILHPLFGRLMIPGGHVESNESAPETARREVAEETGLAITILPAPSVPVPDAVTALGRLVSPPWWILEQPVDSDNHLAQEHIHVDHIYVAIANLAEPLTHPAHPFSWHALGELPTLNMFGDTRALGSQLFGEIESLASQLAETSG